MAAETLLVHHGVARGVSVAVVELVDRRADAPHEPQSWAFQRQVEAVLYGNGYAQQTGAVYRLLQRSGVGHQALDRHATSRPHIGSCATLCAA